MYGIGNEEGELPEYRLNDAADKWEKIVSDGSVELWSFWDGVDWNLKYAIKIDGHFKIVMDEEAYPIPFKVFKAGSTISINFSRTKLSGTSAFTNESSFLFICFIVAPVVRFSKKGSEFISTRYKNDLGTSLLGVTLNRC